MALRSVISSKIPMVIILGATGTGKTKLGVELAQKFGTEIISVDSMQVLTALFHFATGTYQRPVGVAKHLSQKMCSVYIEEVTQALTHPNIINKYIRFPKTHAARQAISQRFHRKYGIPGVVGCIDGSHFKIVVPPKEEEHLYYSRKHYHSLNVQMVCDDEYRILSVNPKFGGANHDSFIWENSDLNTYMQTLHQNGEVVWLLGDSGYPQRPWIMTPILDATPGTPEANYNDKHMTARVLIENTFSRLKNRWRCLHKDRVLHYRPLKCSRIILACSVLHNIIISLGLEDTADMEPIRLSSSASLSHNNRMIIYKGLDIVTAKASRQERELVPHHLLDILEPHQVFTVVDFRARALKIIDKLTKEGKIPIIVGGTNYYVESIVYQILVEHTDDTDELLWDKSKRKRDLDENDVISEGAHKRFANKCDDTENSKDISEVSTPELETKDDNSKGKGDLTPEFKLKDNLSNADYDSTSEFDIKDAVTPQKDESLKIVDIETLKQDVDNESKFSNEEIHSKLKAIDPVMASRLHPNNRRKVLRAIEVWLKTGRRHSEILHEQKISEGMLRRPGATIILWLKCEQSVHDERLNARVDSMVKDGLVQELLDFHDRHNKHRIQGDKPPDYTKGVFQTLGLKEFHNYLMLPPDKKNTDEGKKLLQESIANMKLATRRYARRQNKMVRGRFLEHPSREVPPIYELDATDISKWEDEVKNKAINIIECFINESPCQYEPLKQCISDDRRGIDGHSCNYCEDCKRLIIGDQQFTIHLNSHKHMRIIKKKKQIAMKLEKEKLLAQSENTEK